mmetsp:Transcript_45427/g.102897  ORF Transcript_45427/g.102897 Transcript_45427/m.102897 type:complete len:753 (+) Transcript_45427:113-2371(+)
MSALYSKLNLEHDASLIKVSDQDPLDAHHRRNYDMCMVFRHKTSKLVRFGEQSSEFLVNRVLNEPSEAELSQMLQWQQRREAILKSLSNCGLHLFCYYSRDRDEVIVKIGAGAQKLRDTAARTKYKLQLKAQYLEAYAEYRHDFPGRPENNFKDRRNTSHIYKTYTEDDYPDSDAIFKTIDKIHLLHHIISSADKDCAAVPVGSLLHEGELKAYFPLHEVHALQCLGKDRRQWFLMSEEYAAQLRDYFGDRIAFYFLFLGFYWKWIAPLALIGVVLQLLDVFERTPDNSTAIPFCILMSVWSVFLPYLWKRQEAKQALVWGTLDVTDHLEPTRPQHHGEPRINPVTAQVEPYYPWTERVRHYAFSAATLVFAGALLCFSVLVILLLRHQLKGDVPGGILTFQLALAVFVETTNALLTLLAKWLTSRENHRTQSEHEMHMLAKVMGLKFINSYFVLYYVAFFKKHSNFFGVEMGCVRDDCFLDLQSQLAVFVLFRLTVSNGIEYFFPKLQLWWRSRYNSTTFQGFLHGNSQLELAEMSAAEQQAKKEPYDSFADFDEILISHGFGTLFAVTSPWVCAATLIGTLTEVYVDMRGLLESRQRPIPRHARNNEPWSSLFEIYGALAAITNVFLLVFVSEQYADWTFTERLSLFVYLEHMIIIARVMLQAVLPEVPRNVALMRLKQEQVVHRCLEDIKVEQEHRDYSMFRDRGKDSHIEIFDHDYLDDEDVEPILKLAESAKSMYNGVVDAIRSSEK